MPGSPADVKLVSNAMANATRRKIMAKLVESSTTKEEIAKIVGASMQDYLLQMLQQAGLADINEDTFSLTEFGRNFMESKAEKAILFLAGDGFFNLLENDLEALPQDRILASKEDLDARGVQAGDKAIVPSDFYEQMVWDVMYERR